MAIFSRRLPDWRQILPVMGVIAFPIYTWGILGYLWRIPSLLLNLSLADTFGVGAYLLSFALLETLAVTLILLALSFVLPQPWLRDQFIPMGTAIALMLAIWALTLQWSMKYRAWTLVLLALWNLAFVLLCIFVFRLVHRRPKMKYHLASLADRLVVLMYLYLPLSLVSLVVVAIRLAG